MKRLIFCIILSGISFSALFCGCSKEINLSDYVSENRTCYYKVSSDDGEISLKAYYTLREYPYVADGIKRETSGVFEAEITLGEYAKSAEISFSSGGKEFGGEASYDGVKCVYEYSESVENFEGGDIDFTVTAGGNTYFLSAKNKNSGYLGGDEILEKLKAEKADYINSLVDGGEFLGEIYLRFIFDGKGYYYVGVIDRNENTLSLLFDASTGSIVAERTS